MTAISTGLGERGPAADAIEHARARRGIKQRPLSLRAGLSQSYVSKLEQGQQPSLLGFARLAAVLDLTPLEVWAIIRAEAHRASIGCPRCDGHGQILWSDYDIPALHACPLCRPWPDGFPGEKVDSRWLIPPYGPKETPVWNSLEAAI